MIERWYTIGSFTFPSSWGAVMASFILTFLLLFFWNKKASDWYSNSIFYFVLIWKLSVIIVDFQTVIDHPFTAVYFHGGRIGFWLGLIGALVYVSFKKRVDPTDLTIAWISTVVFYEFACHLLDGEILIGTIQLITNGFLFVFLLKKSKGPLQDKWAVQLVTVFTLLQLLFHSINEGFAYTTITWSYLMVMIYLIFFNRRRNYIE
ncbi:hypothetical protein [Rossellomorea arthrocnemi]|uniref:hypothetical protein n=1 Tax=Rossellomorea arthrocnemi TaxID=2769542 RepID=UPI001919B029|nr:hypothetical protein [Rossellomorea arthrocnemi]